MPDERNEDGPTKAEEAARKAAVKAEAKEAREAAKAAEPENVKARLDEQFAARQAAEAARADEGTSRPAVDERLIEPKKG